MVAFSFFIAFGLSLQKVYRFFIVASYHIMATQGKKYLCHLLQNIAPRPPHQPSVLKLFFNRNIKNVDLCMNAYTTSPESSRPVPLSYYQRRLTDYPAM